MRDRNILISIIIILFILAFGAYFFHAAPTTSVPLEQRLSECGSFPNGSTENVSQTSRMFVNIPKDIYPDINLQIQEHGATAGYISNGGQYGYAMDAVGRPNCWSYYFEFNGSGTVDFISKSKIHNVPDYTLHFVVSPAVIQPDSTWVTASSSLGIWRYPADLKINHVRAVDWPPQLQIIKEPFTCTQAGSETARAGKTEQINVNGNIYCRTTIDEGAAGSTYRQYAFAFPLGSDRTAIFTFTMQFVQCVNYEEPERSACMKDQTSFNADALLDGIRRTLVLY